MMPGNHVITPLVLVGGGGTRLWPVSKVGRPKQFTALLGDRSLFVETMSRLAAERKSGFRFAHPVVIGSQRSRASIECELVAAGVGDVDLVLEPCARNTAPAIAAATLHIASRDEDALVLALPCDHHIADFAAFSSVIESGIDAARAGSIVTFGIEPTAPETGYGYIRRGVPNGAGFRVDRFVEKPTIDVAHQFLADGGYYWNAGIFLFTARAIITALRKHAPEICDAAGKAVEQSRQIDGATVFDQATFAASPALSIDYAVMEHHDDVIVIPARIGWSDIGTWRTLRDVEAKDQHGNVARGRVLKHGVSGSYLRADDGAIAAIGIKNIAVVKSGGNVLVASLDHAQEVRLVEPAIRSVVEQNPAKPVAALEPAMRRMRDWMFDRALPLWIECGWDADNGGFREHLGRDGRPNPEHRRRITVQARQIFVFAAAHLAGWQGPALERAMAGFHWLVDHAWLEEGGWAHSLTPDGTVADATRDLYNHAFAGFAFAWLYRASGDPQVLGWAQRTFAYLDAVLIDPIHGGYGESTHGRLPRRANPHMHLLEALMALFDATGDCVWLDRADTIVALFDRAFFDAASGSVIEEFAADWAAADGPAGTRREPGHHFEWAWLLEQHRARFGGQVAPASNALVAFAERTGFNMTLGLAHDLVDVTGASLSTTHRLWPQTEALRTRVMRAEPDGDEGIDAIETLLERIFEYYLNPITPGLWIDTVNSSGAPLGDTVPASTLYHLMSMTLELLPRTDVA